MQTVFIVLGCIAGFVVLVVGGLYVAGRRGNGAAHETSVEIATTAARVWPFLIEPDRVKQWVGGLETVESLTPEKGVEVGARDRLVVRVNGEAHELFAELTHVEEGVSIAQHLTQSGPMAWHEDARFTIVPVDEQRVRFVVNASYTYTTLLGTILEPLIRIAATKKLNEDLAKLKALAEESRS